MFHSWLLKAQYVLHFRMLTARIRLSPKDAAKHVNEKKRQNPRDPITSITLSKDDWGLQSRPHQGI